MSSLLEAIFDFALGGVILPEDDFTTILRKIIATCYGLASFFGFAAPYYAWRASQESDRAVQGILIALTLLVAIFGFGTCLPTFLYMRITKTTPDWLMTYCLVLAAVITCAWDIVTTFFPVRSTCIAIALMTAASKAPGAIAIIVAICIYYIVVEVRDAFRLQLRPASAYDGSDAERMLFSFPGILAQILMSAMVAGMVHEYTKLITGARFTVKLAQEVAELLLVYDTEGVRDILDGAVHECADVSQELVAAFGKMSENLDLYKPHLPAYVLPQEKSDQGNLGENEIEDDDNANVNELFSGSNNLENSLVKTAKMKSINSSDGSPLQNNLLRRSKASVDSEDNSGSQNSNVINIDCSGGNAKRKLTPKVDGTPTKIGKSNPQSNATAIYGGGFLTGCFTDRTVVCRLNFNDVPLLLFSWRNVKQSMRNESPDCAAVDAVVASARVNALIDKLLESVHHHNAVCHNMVGDSVYVSFGAVSKCSQTDLTACNFLASLKSAMATAIKNGHVTHVANGNTPTKTANANNNNNILKQLVKNVMMKGKKQPDSTPKIDNAKKAYRSTDDEDNEEEMEGSKDSSSHDGSPKVTAMLNADSLNKHESSLRTNEVMSGDFNASQNKQKANANHAGEGAEDDLDHFLQKVQDNLLSGAAVSGKGWCQVGGTMKRQFFLLTSFSNYDVLEEANNSAREGKTFVVCRTIRSNAEHAYHFRGIGVVPMYDDLAAALKILSPWALWAVDASLAGETIKDASISRTGSLRTASCRSPLSIPPLRSKRSFQNNNKETSAGNQRPLALRKNNCNDNNNDGVDAPTSNVVKFSEYQPGAIVDDEEETSRAQSTQGRRHDFDFDNGINGNVSDVQEDSNAIDSDRDRFKLTKKLVVFGETQEYPVTDQQRRASQIKQYLRSGAPDSPRNNNKLNSNGRNASSNLNQSDNPLMSTPVKRKNSVNGNVLQVISSPNETTANGDQPNDTIQNQSGIAVLASMILMSPSSAHGLSCGAVSDFSLANVSGTLGIHNNKNSTLFSNDNLNKDRPLGAPIYELCSKRKIQNDDEWMYVINKQKQTNNNAVGLARTNSCATVAGKQQQGPTSFPNNKTSSNHNNNNNDEEEEQTDELVASAMDDRRAANEDYLEHLINPECVGERLNEVVAFLARGNVGKAKSLLHGIVKTEPEAVDLFCFRKVTECCAVFENALREI